MTATPPHHPIADPELDPQAESIEPCIDVIVVNFNDHALLPQCVASINDQAGVNARVILVDNDPEQRGVIAVQTAAVFALAPAGNIGFAAGCNQGAAAGNSPYIAFVNPDVILDDDCLLRLVTELQLDDSVAITGAQLLLPDGTVNAGDNPVHVTGIAWSGRYGEPPETGGARTCAAVSGACMMIRRNAFEKLDGFCPEFFTYVEDVDLCLRAILSGLSVRFVPEARATHFYEFGGTKQKWFYLERNRAWMLLTVLDTRTLVLLAPLLAASEIGVVAASVAGGWFPAKMRATKSVVASSSWIRTRRRTVKRTKMRSDSVVWELMTTELSGSLISVRAARLANPIVKAYSSLVNRWLLS